MKKLDSFVQESKLFFQISSELLDAQRNDAEPAEINQLVDEIEAMLSLTDYPQIRERCARLLGRFQESVAGTAG